MKHKPYGPYEQFIKRPQDFLCALLAIIVLSPVWLIVAILVRVKLGSPILFTQDRPGRNGKVFRLYKFRTMLPPKDGVIDPSQDAARMTPFGNKLRSMSLDELPELFNILKGDMAVVGPRPLLVRYLYRYNEHQARRHSFDSDGGRFSVYVFGSERIHRRLCAVDEAARDQREDHL